MSETQNLTDMDGLVEFGQYLNAIREIKHRSYTFEMLSTAGALTECSLDEVIQSFQSFFEGKTQSIRIRFTYFDCQMGILGCVDREFKRKSE